MFDLACPAEHRFPALNFGGLAVAVETWTESSISAELRSNHGRQRGVRGYVHRPARTVQARVCRWG